MGMSFLRASAFTSLTLDLRRSPAHLHMLKHYAFQTTLQASLTTPDHLHAEQHSDQFSLANSRCQAGALSTHEKHLSLMVGNLAGKA